jgi:hypothetical protein
VAGRVIVNFLPAPSLDVSLRTATLLLAILVASLGFCHKENKPRFRAAGIVLAVSAAVLAACLAALPARRGVPLAHMIAQRIGESEGIDIPVGILDITFYRDDLTLRSEHPVVNDTIINFNTTDKIIILVDDRQG